MPAEDSSLSFDICPLLTTNASVLSTEKTQKNSPERVYDVLQIFDIYSLFDLNASVLCLEIALMFKVLNFEKHDTVQFTLVMN